MGVEPTTTWSTVRDSAIELQAPWAGAIIPPASTAFKDAPDCDLYLLLFNGGLAAISQVLQGYIPIIDLIRANYQHDLQKQSN